MRVFWMKIKYITSAFRLMNRVWVNKGGLDLSKEVLWVFLGQRAAKLPAIKLGGLKKICHLAWLEPATGQKSKSTYYVSYLHQKYPRFNSTYLVRVPFDLTVAVYHWYGNTLCSSFTKFGKFKYSFHIFDTREGNCNTGFSELEKDQRRFSLDFSQRRKL